MTDLVPDLDHVRTRVEWIDKLRGLAIVLMVLDHTLAAVAPSSIVRLTATRLSLPLFMLCAAMVWRPGLDRRRLAWIIGCVLVEAALFPAIGLPLPGIMLGIAAVTILVALRPVVASRPWMVATLGFIGFLYLGLGTIAAAFAWWGLGRAAHRSFPHELAPAARHLPGVLATVGRHPIGFYIGHLFVLAVAVQGATP